MYVFVFALVVSLHCTDQCLFVGRIGVQPLASRVCLEQQGGALQSAYVDAHKEFACIYLGLTIELFIRGLAHLWLCVWTRVLPCAALLCTGFDNI